MSVLQREKPLRQNVSTKESCRPHGRFKRACRSGGQVESEELFIGTLTGPRSAENSAWFSNFLVGGKTVKFKLGAGAEANVLTFSVYSKLKNKSPLLETSVVLSSYGEFKVKLDGKLNLSCKVQGMEQTLRVFVVAVESPSILELSACLKLNLVRRVESLAQSPLTKCEIMKEFSDVFSGFGRMEGEYHTLNWMTRMTKSSP